MGDYKVGLGESPMSIAGALSGDPGRYGELLLANPHKPLARVGGRVTFVVLVAGEILNVPHGWDRPHPRLRRFTALPDGYLGASGDTLGTNQGLRAGESITSPDGNVSLVFQPDGNLVIKKNSDGTVLWQSGTANRGGVIAWMNHDGNLRVEAPGGEAAKLWDNGAHGHKDARARIENTGNLFVWDGANHQIWDAGASLARPNPVPGGHGAAHTDFGGVNVNVNVGAEFTHLTRGIGGLTNISRDLRDLSKDLKHFSRDLIDDVKKFGPMILSEVQGLISLVPGIGTGISSAIGLAMALIEGGSPLEIAIRAAYGAIPIPPGIRNVTDPIVDGAIRFAEHPHDFTDVAINTVRDQIPGGLPREVFDTLVKVIIKRQPILKVVSSVAAEVANLPVVQSVVSAMPPVGTILPSIRQIAPHGVHVDVAAIPGMLQAAQAQVQQQLDPAALASIAQQAQQRYAPLHALAVMTSATQLAQQLGGTHAAVAVLEHPLVAPAAIATRHLVVPVRPIPQHPGGRPPYPPYMHGRAGGHTAAYLPYMHGGAPIGRHGVHGVGECAPPCSQLGEPVDMDARMSQVARMLVTARRGQPTIAKGPDGVDYRFEDVDGAVVARRCLG